MKTSNERFRAWTQHIYHHFAVDLGEVYLEEKRPVTDSSSKKKTEARTGAKQQRADQSPR